MFKKIFTVLIIFIFSSVCNLAQGQTSYEKDSTTCMNMMLETGRCFNEGKTDSAIFFAEKAYSIAQKIFGRKSEITSMGAQILGMLHQQKKQYNKAETYMVEAVEICRELYGEDKPEFAESLGTLAGLYKIIYRYTEAIVLYKQEQTVYKTSLGTENAQYAQVLQNLGSTYGDLGNYMAAEPLYKESMETRKRVLGAESPKYATSLNNMAWLQIQLGNYSLAEPLYKTALAINKIYGETNENVALNLNNLAYLYKTMGRTKEAKEFFLQALAIRKKLFGEYNEDYANSLNGLSVLYQEMADYITAEKLCKQALNIRRKVLGEESHDYALSLNDLALLYDRKGEFSISEKTYKQSLQIIKQTLGEDHPYYSIGLNNLGSHYSDMGNYAAAEKCYLEAYQKLKATPEYSAYPKAISGLAGVYIDMGNYAAAEPLYIESREIDKKHFGTENLSYGNSVSNLGLLYRFMEKDSLSEQLYKEALSVYEKSVGKEHSSYANCLNSLAGLYYLNSMYKDAEPLYKQALAINEKLFGKGHPTFSLSLHNMAVMYQVMGNHKKADSLYKQALQIRKKVYGTKNINYVETLAGQAGNYYAANKEQSWKAIIDEAVTSESSSDKIMLQHFSEAEKETYLVKNSNWQNTFLSMLYHFNGSNTKPFYQYTSERRGSLLKSKQQLINLAYSSNDTLVKALLERWQNTNAMYATAIQLTEEKRKQGALNADSLMNASKQQEKKLISLMPQLASSINNSAIEPKKVAAKLKPNEAVLQWVSFKYKAPNRWTDSILYAAFVIRSKDSVPKFLGVCEEAQLSSLLKTYHGASGRSTIKSAAKETANVDALLYDIIWKPLLPYLKGINTVYNLPAGLLHKVSFGAMKDSASKQELFDQYELHQLMSIDQLMQPSNNTKLSKTIALFGGADYNGITANENVQEQSVQPDYRNASTEKNISFSYLPGTLAEANEVIAIAKQTDWKVNGFTGTQASEASLKQLSGGNKATILHIATHGFYFPPPKNVEDNGNRNSQQKDFPLLRSGIVLTGANNYWGKDTLLANGEDGIVTAQEISSLNLTATDLVVLSACQTALGDINSSEGVYGLQRAFKIAGAKKLLLSLWEVPDAETAELMQLFYQAVFNGETYYKALRNAQLTLKAKYSNPTKWAGFVLIGE